MGILRRGNNRGLILNPSHPAAKGAVFLGVANGAGNRMIDVITHQTGTSNGSAAYALDPFMGHAVNLNTGTTTDIRFTNRITTTYNQGTIACLFQVTALPSAVSPAFSDNATASAGTRIGLNASNVTVFSVNNGSASGLTAVAGGVYFVIGSWWVGGSGLPNRQSVHKRLDGGSGSTALVINTGTPALTTVTPDGTIYIGTQSATAYWHGDVAMAFSSRSKIGMGEMLAWANDPWSIFQRGNDWTALSSKNIAAATIPNTLVSRYQAVQRASFY